MSNFNQYVPLTVRITSTVVFGPHSIEPLSRAENKRIEQNILLARIRQTVIEFCKDYNLLYDGSALSVEERTE